MLDKLAPLCYSVIFTNNRGCKVSLNSKATKSSIKNILSMKANSAAEQILNGEILVDNVTFDSATQFIASELNSATVEMKANSAGSRMGADVMVAESLNKATQQMLTHAALYRKSITDMCVLQSELLATTKVLTQKSKDYTGQLGDALARIDKVMVRDFETKLVLLERFVVATKELVELDKHGTLLKLAGALK